MNGGRGPTREPGFKEQKLKSLTLDGVGEERKNPTTAKDIYWFFCILEALDYLSDHLHIIMWDFLVFSTLHPILGCCRKKINASWLFTCPLCMLCLLSYCTDLSSALLSSPQSKDKKSKWHSQEFWMMLTSLQPSPPAKVGRHLVTERHWVSHSSLISNFCNLDVMWLESHRLASLFYSLKNNQFKGHVLL